MSRRPVWTIQADETFGEILAYIRQEWGVAAAQAFFGEVEHTVDLLVAFPEGGILERPELGIRSIPVARQVRLFYRLDDELLILLELIDVRTQRFQGMRGEL
ncbi:MAG TPA: type II toxin-antitoxin system RelE/ParE family toxin [Flavobacteriales bacterium]|nr:type II toxin-antitoxin system RelE/ParE family toxin [Flavobacteriales bacterium]HMR26833.1 type II toxin-antitoxin system RelE/ParE family toxin [Flavobacteriales bacterium]